MEQVSQMLETYSEIGFNNEMFGHYAEEKKEDDAVEDRNQQQPSSLDASIMKFAHVCCDEYGTPVDIDTFQILEETTNGWTHSEIIVAIQLLLLKGELLHVEEEGSLLAFPATETHRLKQMDRVYDITTTNKSWFTRVWDRVYNIFAQGNDMTCASIFAKMELTCTAQEVQ